MAEIVTVGEIIVEMVATERDQPLDAPGLFAGPYPSGAPAIFIDQAARMGRSAAIVGCVGQDGFADCVLTRLAEDGVETRFVRRTPDAATGLAFVTYRGDGSRQFLFHIANAAPGLLRPEDVTAEAFAGCRILHIMGSALFSPEMGACVRRAVTLATDAGALLSFDPNVRVENMRRPGVADLIEELAARADIFMPGDEDLHVMRPGIAAEDAAAAFLRRRARLVLLKQGARGSIYMDRTERFHTPAFPVTEVDPTGAGDCTCATFLAGWLDGRPPRDAARRANAAGALAVAKRGPMEGNSTEAELRAILSSAA